MLNIKTRNGHKPITGDQPPHLQFSEISPRDIYNSLNDWVFSAFDQVRETPTLISVPTSRALWLDEQVDVGPEFFMPPQGSREFAHTHEDGSMHLMLSRADERRVMEADWGELHPWHDNGVKEILIYAPRDLDELETIKTIVGSSYNYVTKSGSEISACTAC
jgi:hypothetical protein